LDNAAPILAFSEKDRGILLAVLRNGINTPRTSSAGRLFDAVASLLGIRQIANHEGQAAMELEFALAGVETNDEYSFAITRTSGPAVVDWEPMVRTILGNIEDGRAVSEISAKFHNTLASVIAKMALELGESRVVLTGGCFQNRYLTEKTVSRLECAGLRPYWHQRIPPNDGGIALGQVAAAEYFESMGDEN
jgi:hydrogenase maturation protein HypF